ncbi:hypothetical protein [Vibrio sonorensis]|uniref:hypothetical protein n=1 Tax=Vibrio sonorensis TaxID=1004316 RepID=UPI001FE028BA|nr:hypothetical protein [Vibrio sonorensis]
MDTTTIMRQFNEFERKHISLVNGVQVSEDGLVKFVSNGTYGSYISYFDFPEDEAEKRVLREIEYFKKKGVCFEWKTYTTDTPSTLSQVLLRHGFVQEETESFMVLDLNDYDAKPFNDSEITQVTDAQGIRDAIEVQQQVWGET